MLEQMLTRAAAEIANGIKSLGEAVNAAIDAPSINEATYREIISMWEPLFQKIGSLNQHRIRVPLDSDWSDWYFGTMLRLLKQVDPQRLAPLCSQMETVLRLYIGTERLVPLAKDWLADFQKLETPVARELQAAMQEKTRLLEHLAEAQKFAKFDFGPPEIARIQRQLSTNGELIATLTPRKKELTPALAMRALEIMAAIPAGLDPTPHSPLGQVKRYENEAKRIVALSQQNATAEAARSSNRQGPKGSKSRQDALAA